MRAALLLFAAAASASGCVSTTLINSRPDRARVFVDGRDIGETPATWSDTVWAGSKNTVRLSLPGYRDTTTYIAADQWHVGRTIASALCFLPGLLWSTDYKPSYEFSLQPDPGAGYQQPQFQQPGYPPQGGYPPPQGYPPQPGYPPPGSPPPQQPQTYPPPAQTYPPPPSDYPPPPPPM